MCERDCVCMRVRGERRGERVRKKRERERLVNAGLNVD